MGVLAAGTVVTVPFPFSDSSQVKVRPAVCLADAHRGEWVLCQITSTGQGDPSAVSIGPGDFDTGGLHHHSFAIPSKLFTAHQQRFIRTIGQLTDSSLLRLIDGVVSILRP